MKLPNCARPARWPEDENKETIMRMNTPNRRAAGMWLGRAATLLLSAGLVLGTGSAAAQNFPNRNVRIIVPFGTGSVLDLLARLLAEPLSKSLGQPVVVDNIAGAGGVPGTQQMVQSAKDGHTLALTNNSHVINPSVYKNLAFDSLRDVAPIAVLGNTPLVLVVNPKLPGNLRELIAQAKARPGALTYGSSGNGGAVHLAGVLLASEGGIDIRHIPYKQPAQMITDLLGGVIDMVVYSVPAVAAHLESGKLRAVAISTQQRSALLPNVPTMAESGLPGYDFGGWLILLAPAGVPQPVINRLNAEVRAALALKETQTGLARLGVLPMDNTLEYANRFLAVELEKHTMLVKKSGASFD